MPLDHRPPAHAVADLERRALPAMASLTVLDLGLGMAAALVAKMLADMGARVIRMAPPQGDPFDDIYPAHRYWRAGAQSAEVNALPELITAADVCIVGGEDFPDLEWRFDPLALAAMNREAVILHLTGDLSDDGGPVADILAQAATGFAFEHYPDRPMHFAWPGPTYGAALLGAYGVLAALLGRARGGSGDVVRVSLQQGAAMWWSVFWMSAERPDAEFADTVVPKGVRQLIFECADGRFIQFVTRAPGDLAKLYRALGIEADVDPWASGMANYAGGTENYYGDTRRYAEHVRKFARDELLAALWAADIAAEAVLAPGECWDDPQCDHNGILRRGPDGVQHVGLPIDLEIVVADGGKPPGARPSRPLEGLRIVDFGHLIAGPYASRLLADLGADVIKVEPLTGDMNRSRYRSHVAASVGKRSICVDAKASEGRAILAQLAATADAAQHNFRPGVAARLGLDPATLRMVRPDIVTLETTAYGAAGPKAPNPGYDMIMQAYCGLDVRAGGEGNLPAWCRAWIVDYATGALGAIGLLAGLLEQVSSGSAVEAQTNLLSSGVFLISELLRDPDGGFRGAELANREQTGRHPAERLYRTSDGWIAIAARSEKMAADLAGVVGAALPPRRAWREAEGRAVAEVIGSWTTDEATQRLAESGVWAAPCVADGWAALQATAAELVTTVADARYGRLTCVGSLVRAPGPAGRPQLRPAPAPGEHTREILTELGYGPDEIAGLYARQVVR